jgi:Family of unknown function (DUF6951)
VCKFLARIDAHSDDQQHVGIAIQSECEKIRSLGDRLDEVDSYEEIKDGFDGRVYQAVRASVKGCCSGCTVPSGLFKAMQVAAGLALPIDAEIHFCSTS